MVLLPDCGVSQRARFVNMTRMKSKMRSIGLALQHNTGYISRVRNEESRVKK